MAFGVDYQSESTPCVTDEQLDEIHRISQHNADSLEKLGVFDRLSARRSGSLLYDYPLRAVSSRGALHAINLSNYVDHDTSSGQLDHNCGTHTYNGHGGTDYVHWPFPWYCQENDLIEVVAVQEGVLVGKRDTSNDTSCVWNFNRLPNYVSIRHADTTTGVYLHMKQGSITIKSIGDTIAKGEKIGVVGSSGISSISHLHFHPRYKNGQIFDPHFGSCNPNVSSSKWASPEPYRPPHFNAAFTHYTRPKLGNCKY